MLDPREICAGAEEKLKTNQTSWRFMGYKNEIATGAADSVQRPVRVCELLGFRCDQNINFTTFKWAHKNTHKTNINFSAFIYCEITLFRNHAAEVITLTPFSIIASMMPFALLLSAAVRDLHVVAQANSLKDLMCRRSHGEEFRRLILIASFSRQIMKAKQQFDTNTRNLIIAPSVIRLCKSQTLWLCAWRL